MENSPDKEMESIFDEQQAQIEKLEDNLREAWNLSHRDRLYQDAALEVWKAMLQEGLMRLNLIKFLPKADVVSMAQQAWEWAGIFVRLDPRREDRRVSSEGGQ